MNSHRHICKRCGAHFEQDGKKSECIWCYAGYPLCPTCEQKEIAKEDAANRDDED